MSIHRVAVIGGDGIGPAVTAEALRVLRAAGVELAVTEFELGAARYLRDGFVLDDATLAELGQFDAILLGAIGPAIGDTRIPSGLLERGLLLKMRFGLDLFINFRPFRGVENSLAEGCEFAIVRENTEGEYSAVGGRMFGGTDREMVMQESIFTRYGVDRVLKFAYELAQSRPKKHLTAATKSNGIAITMPYWDERLAEMAQAYPSVKTDKFHIDILTAHFVQRPDFFDVVVASNLFGDILSDLGPACTGTIGIAPSANLNPDRKFPSLFEPVHGSAPDIAGRGLANPIGQIWCGAMMLEFLGHKEAHDAILAAIEKVLLPGSGAPKTPDIGGNASTSDLGRAIAQAL